MKNYIKYIIPILLAFIAVPVFMFAQSESGITSNPCLVRIYHTNFPLGAGQIVERDGQLYYARTYLPGCANAAQGTGVVVSGSTTVPAPVSTGQAGSGVVNFLVGNPCYIRVYHTNFMFPPEGGVIISVNGEMYFVPEYLPGCSSAASAGTVIRRAGQPPVATVPQTGGGTVIGLVVGDPCFVPIYHTNFQLNGGRIVEVDGKLWYVKSYLPQCANATAPGGVSPTPSPTPTPTPTPAPPPSIPAFTPGRLPIDGSNLIAFGDSLVVGVGASAPTNNFVSLITERTNSTIINAGRSGDTTATALARLQTSVLDRDPKVVIVVLGGNDILRGVPEEQIFANLEEIVRRIDDTGAAIILVGVEGPGAEGYNARYAEIAAQYNATFVPNVMSGIVNNPALTIFDRIHPNNAGYKLIADRIEPAFRYTLGL